MDSSFTNDNNTSSNFLQQDDDNNSVDDVLSSTTSVLPQQQPSAGIAAVAARIHERAIQVAQEQEALDDAKKLHEEIQNVYKETMKQRKQIRYEYCQYTVQMHSIEIECINIEKRIDENYNEIKKLQQQENDLIEQLNKEKLYWNDNIQNNIIQHQIKLELYQKYINNDIDNCEKNKQKRNKQLEILIQENENIQIDYSTTLQQQYDIQNEIHNITEYENNINNQVEILASNVRTEVTKRSELREKLQEVQQAYQNAHDDADIIANEYRNL